MNSSVINIYEFQIELQILLKLNVNIAYLRYLKLNCEKKKSSEIKFDCLTSSLIQKDTLFMMKHDTKRLRNLKPLLTIEHL